jgi:uncharacterized protein YndB with AHSA1/START domain
MNAQKSITVEVVVRAPIPLVWSCWIKPEHITKWAFASGDWEAPYAENDVKIGGNFLTRMAAKDGSAGFDFTGVYTFVKEQSQIDYTMDDGREVSIVFTQEPEGVGIQETFEMEEENSRELQQSGWQSILDNFKKYTEDIAVS